MLIDGYDQYAQQDAEVVDIQPDDAEDTQDEAPLRADDCILLHHFLKQFN